MLPEQYVAAAKGGRLWVESGGGAVVVAVVGDLKLTKLKACLSLNYYITHLNLRKSGGPELASIEIPPFQTFFMM